MSDSKPIFSGELNVLQTSKRSARLQSIGGALAIAVFVAAAIAFVRLLDGDTSGDCGAWCGAGAIAGIIVLSLLLVAMLILLFFLPSLLAASTGWLKDFYGDTRVTIDANGVRIDGLGLCPPAEMLTLTGMADYENAVVIHTARMGTLRLCAADPKQLQSAVLPALNACMPIAGVRSDNALNLDREIARKL